MWFWNINHFRMIVSRGTIICALLLLVNSKKHHHRHSSEEDEAGNEADEPVSEVEKQGKESE